VRENEVYCESSDIHSGSGVAQFLPLPPRFRRAKHVALWLYGLLALGLYLTLAFEIEAYLAAPPSADCGVCNNSTQQNI
jgi:hypothetical protein